MQRVRCFLNTEGEMKVAPWASVEETLDAFYDVLESHRNTEKFWEGLEGLLGGLAEDACRRAKANKPDLIVGEVIDLSERKELLEEIRKVLEKRNSGHGRFRRFAKALSAPALGALLLVSGVATAGCGASTGFVDDADSDRVTDADGDADADADSDTDAEVDADADVDAEVDADADVDEECEPVGETFEEILEECLPAPEHKAYRNQILACVDGLHESWREGLTEHFRCMECHNIEYDLDSCLMHGFDNFCDNPAAAGEFDVETFIDNCAIMLYLGVRFE